MSQSDLLRVDQSWASDSSRSDFCTCQEEQVLFRLFIAFSRNERTHPNLVSQAREIEIFCEDCKLATPLSFFRGFEPRFRVDLLRHACSPLWFF